MRADDKNLEKDFSRADEMVEMRPFHRWHFSSFSLFPEENPCSVKNFKENLQEFSLKSKEQFA